MTRKDYLKCVSLARSQEFCPIPYLTLEVFSGCALDSKRRAVTQIEVASLIYGHCMTFAGTWLHHEENEIEGYSKRFDLIG